MSLRLTRFIGWMVFTCTILTTPTFAERQWWPLFSELSADSVGRFEQDFFLGPVGGETIREDLTISSFRPLYTQFDFERDADDHWHVLYPFLNHYRTTNGFHWHILNLVSGERNRAIGLRGLDVFPFIFYRDSNLEETDYLAIWPIAGGLKNRFFRDEIQFAFWPLWVRTLKGDETRWHFPYPFLRYLDGPQSSGFGVWPLYGQFEKEGTYQHRWALWPLYYDYKDRLNTDDPYSRFGLWPFYHREKANGLSSHSFVWPFFGWTHEQAPRPDYREYRIFWPFLIQGFGEEKRVNRWLPIYSSERVPGAEKHWYLWPILKTQNWESEQMERDRQTVLYFFFQNERQRFEGTIAQKTTLWPLASYWNDGFEHRQFQFFDPLTVFFPRNEKVRENWSPLFSIYRYDRREEDRRHHLLWNLIHLRYGGEVSELTVGPLWDWEKSSSGVEWNLLKGLLGYESERDSKGFKFLWIKWGKGENND